MRIDKEIEMLQQFNTEIEKRCFKIINQQST